MTRRPASGVICARSWAARVRVVQRVHRFCHHREDGVRVGVVPEAQDAAGREGPERGHGASPVARRREHEGQGSSRSIEGGLRLQQGFVGSDAHVEPVTPPEDDPELTSGLAQSGFLDPIEREVLGDVEVVERQRLERLEAQLVAFRDLGAQRLGVSRLRRQCGVMAVRDHHIPPRARRLRQL